MKWGNLVYKENKNLILFGNFILSYAYMASSILSLCQKKRTDKGKVCLSKRRREEPIEEKVPWHHGDNKFVFWNLINYGKEKY